MGGMLQGFVGGLAGNLSDQIQQRHEEDLAERQRQRQLQEKILFDTSGVFSDADKAAAFAELKKVSGPQARKALDQHSPLLRGIHALGQLFRHPAFAQTGGGAPQPDATTGAAATPAQRFRQGPAGWETLNARALQARRDELQVQEEAQLKLKQDERNQQIKALDEIPDDVLSPARKAEIRAEIIAGRALPAEPKAPAHYQLKGQQGPIDPDTGKPKPGSWTITNTWNADKQQYEASYTQEEPKQSLLQWAYAARDDPHATQADKDAAATIIKQQEAKTTPKLTGDLAQREAAQNIIDDPNATKEQKNQAQTAIAGLDAKISATKARGAAAAGTPATLSPEEAHALARWHIETGGNPSFGLGKNNPDRALYNQAYAEELLNNPQAAADRAAFRGGQSNMQSLMRMRGQAGSVESMFQLDLKNAREAASDLEKSSAARTSLRKFNEWQQFALANLSDQPELAAFRVATQTLMNQYARLMFSATGGGTSTDTARAHAEELLNTAMASGAFNAAISQMEKEAKNRVAGIDTQIEEQKKQMVPSGAKPAAPTPVPAPSAKAKPKIKILRIIPGPLQQ